VIEASDCIGSEFTKILSDKYPDSLYAFSRAGEYCIDYMNEKSIVAATETAYLHKGNEELVNRSLNYDYS
jgi:hypothetical protein